MTQFSPVLTGLLLPELEELLSPLPRFRASQVYKWISSGISGFEEMTNLPKPLRDELKKKYLLYSGIISGIHDDIDAKKIVITLNDGLQIEAVLLNDEKKRLTACLSTQAGCPAGCVFCKTGLMGLTRNLTPAEIVEQFLFLQRIVKQNSESNIHNIVIMGMGEPLLNLTNLYKALAVFTDSAGINYSKRRITVSTCGIYEGLSDIAKNKFFRGTRLALSLTTADETLRQELMPITVSNPLHKIKEALLLFQNNGGGRITLEIPLLGGINTRRDDVMSIVEFAKGLDTVVNIIPWNPVKDLMFKDILLNEPDKKEIENFTLMLKNYGLKVTKRRRKGRGILAACGQLGKISS